MRILIFHGYLLGGTGSNVYNARLAEALVGLGHEVHLLCQERHPDRHAFVDAAGDWDEGSLRLRALTAATAGGPGSCTVYRPNVGALLPVYVADRYEGLEARTFADCSDEELAAYVHANVATVAEVRALADPEIALANHLVMGPAVLARALGGTVPYAVKVHGSALEYAVRPQPERLLPFAREGLAGAEAILVGSRHTARSLWELIDDPDVRARTRLGPPGVDVRRFAPREPRAAAAGLRALSERLSSAGGGGGAGDGDSAGDGGGGEEAQSAFARDEAAAGRALARLDGERDALVAFVGKLIVSKGADLLVAAWPLVLERVAQARLVVVGFGAYRGALERLLGALQAGDVDGAREIARAGRALEAGGSSSPRPLRHLLAFLEGLEGAGLERYVSAAASLGERVVLSGRLDHDELAELLPACRALVAPSTFPEAFGMVAVEAAACGALPVCASHSGLAEVTAALAQAVPSQAAPWLSFPLDDDPVRGIAERLVGWLSAEPSLRERTRAALVSTARERWSWQGVARGVIAAAQGRLEDLPAP